MFNPSSIQPDVELREFLQGKVTVGEDKKPVTVYGDWERPTNEVPDDFIVIMQNGNPMGLGMDVDFAKGFLAVSLYSKLNNDGSVKKKRVDKILKQVNDQFVGGGSGSGSGDERYEPIITENYVYQYDPQQFITPTTPNITSGYSITSLNLRWTTNNNFNKPVTP
jgi:hypothetical protein